MKRLFYFCAAVCVLLCSCSKSTSFVLEIPELTQGTVLVVSTNPEQIESGAMDTLAFAEFDGGRFETAFDSLKFEDKYMDCSVLIRTKEGKIAGNMVLPLERGKQTVVKVKDVVRFLNNESYLTIGYSGNKYAEDFSAFYSKLAGFEEMIVTQNDSQKKNEIRKKQVELYKEIFEKYPASGSAYTLLIGQVLKSDARESDPVTEYCDGLCLNVNYENKWANFLCDVMKERKKTALSSSVLSFSAFDINGNSLTERDIKPHEYVLVCFWASWCSPCREEIPLLKELYSEYNAKGLEIVSISIDTTPAMWEEFSKQNPLPWLSLIGDGRELTSRYDFEMIPMNIIVNKEGKVIKRELFGEDIRKAVKELFE